MRLLVACIITILFLSSFNSVYAGFLSDTQETTSDSYTCSSDPLTYVKCKGNEYEGGPDIEWKQYPQLFGDNIYYTCTKKCPNCNVQKLGQETISGQWIVQSTTTDSETCYLGGLYCSSGDSSTTNIKKDFCASSCSKCVSGYSQCQPNPGASCATTASCPSGSQPTQSGQSASLCSSSGLTCEVFNIYFADGITLQPSFNLCKGSCGSQGLSCSETECNNNGDDDSDGLTDMADPDCQAKCTTGYRSDLMTNPSATDANDGCCGDDNELDYGLVSGKPQYLCSSSGFIDAKAEKKVVSITRGTNNYDYISNGVEWFTCDTKGTFTYTNNKLTEGQTLKSLNAEFKFLGDSIDYSDNFVCHADGVNSKISPCISNSQCKLGICFSKGQATSTPKTPTTMFCSGFGKWLPDLDRPISGYGSDFSFEQYYLPACNVNYKWTGSKCCGDDITTVASTKETYMDSGIKNSACYENELIAQNILKDNLLSFNGILRRCKATDAEMSGLNSKLTYDDKFYLPTEKLNFENADYCSVPKNSDTDVSSYFCSYDKVWSTQTFIDNIDNTVVSASKRSAQKTIVQTLASNPNLKQQECCPTNYCYNGTNCVRGYNDYFFPSKQKNFLSYVGKFNTDPVLDMCYSDNNNANWIKVYRRDQWYEEDYGYCPKQSQCWYSDSTTNGFCYEDKQYVEKSDLICDNGNWTSRTKKVAESILNITEQNKLKDVTFLCSDDVYVYTDYYLGYTAYSACVAKSNQPDFLILGYIIQKTTDIKTVDNLKTHIDIKFNSNSECIKTDSYAKCSITSSRSLIKSAYYDFNTGVLLLSSESTTFNIITSNLSFDIVNFMNFSIHSTDKLELNKIVPKLKLFNKIMVQKKNNNYYVKAIKEKVLLLIDNTNPVIREFSGISYDNILDYSLALETQTLQDKAKIDSKVSLSEYYSRSIDNLFGSTISISDAVNYNANPRYVDYLWKSQIGKYEYYLDNTKTTKKSGFSYYSNCLTVDGYNVSKVPDNKIALYENNLYIINKKQKEGCCLNSECFTGQYCSTGFTKSEILGVDFADRFSDPYGVKNMYACVQNQGWTKVFYKMNWDNTSQGYCFSNDQCWISNKKGCIDKDTYSADLFDHYCDAGNWTTRTKLIAQQLIKFAEDNFNSNIDYSIYCDSYEYALNNPFPGLSNLISSTPKFNNFCVLNKNGEFVLAGVSLNDVTVKEFVKDIIVDLDSNYKLDDIACSTEKTGKYALCDDKIKKIWYNANTNSIIFTKKSGLELPDAPSMWSRFVDIIVAPFRSLYSLFVTQDKVQIEELTNDYNKLYLFKNSNKEIKGLVEDTTYSKKYMLIQYYNFDFDPCTELTESTKNLISCYKGQNLINISSYDQTSITKYWPILTAKSRVK